MLAAGGRFVAVLLVAGGLLDRLPSRAIGQAHQPPGTLVTYRIEPRADTGADLRRRFTGTQIAILEKLNRADLAHLSRLDQLVVPSGWDDDDLRYSPFPLEYEAATHVAKLLVVDQPTQAFAAYQAGKLVRWGPVSSGRQACPTPSGVFHLNWRSRGRHSSIDPNWYMEWYFNFDTRRGLALHSYALPGYPASHACIRLLERDAIWIYDWAEGWTLDSRGRIVNPGTALIVAGHYEFATTRPWRSFENLARGVALPEALLPP